MLVVVDDEVVVDWPVEESEPGEVFVESEDEPDALVGLMDPDGPVESEEDPDDAVESEDELGEEE